MLLFRTFLDTLIFLYRLFVLFFSPLCIIVFLCSIFKNVSAHFEEIAEVFLAFLVPFSVLFFHVIRPAHIKESYF